MHRNRSSATKSALIETEVTMKTRRDVIIATFRMRKEYLEMIDAFKSDLGVRS